VALALTVLVMLLASPALAENRPATGGALSAALDSSPTDLHPWSPLIADAELAALLYDAVFRCEDGRATPLLADLENTGTRARLRLHADVRFHDGTVARAQDLASSLNRALQSRVRWMLGSVKSVRLVGDVVELELSRPAPELPQLLCTPAAYLLPEKLDAAHLVGTGPFKLSERQPGQIHLKANIDYFAGRPYLDDLFLRTFSTRTEESGTFQVGQVAAMRHGGKASAHEDAGERVLTGYIAFGSEVTDDSLRRAVALALGRERMVRYALRDPAEAASGNVPPALGGPGGAGKKGTRAPDAEQARQLLRGRTFSLKLTVDRGRFDDKMLADFILADLQRVGLEVVIEQVDSVEYRRRLETGTFGLLLGTAVPSAPSAALSALTLLALVDPTRAQALCAQSCAEAPPEDARVVPLFFRGARVQHQEKVGGMRIDALGRPTWTDAYWMK
jgi:MarR-like DNA-binding transcriptional regulator SgrR of sgrS sRNA